MRLLIALSLSFAAIGASASFDLMFAQGATSDSSGAYRIYRMDPTTGTMLGSFSSGPSTYGMAANLSRGELYTLDINGNLRTWDYSQGSLKSIRYIGWTQINDFTLSPDGNEIISAHSNGDVRAYNLLTSTSTGVSAVGFSGTKIVALSPTVYLTYAPASHSLRRVVRTGSTFAASTSEAVSASIAPATVTSLGVLNSINGYKYIHTGSSAGPTMGFNYVSTSSNDFAGFGPFTLSYSGFTSVNGLVGSHNGMYVVGQESGGGTRITESDSAGYLVRSNIVTGIPGGVRSVAIVLAPEPGSLVMLSLGFVALARSRKQR